MAVLRLSRRASQGIHSLDFPIRQPKHASIFTVIKMAIYSSGASVHDSICWVFSDSVSGLFLPFAKEAIM